MNLNPTSTRRSPLVRRLVRIAAAVALAAAGSAHAAVLYVEHHSGWFLAEVFPNGDGYQYDWTVTPNLTIDQNLGDAISGHCLYGGFATVYVTVTYPTGDTESRFHGVNCNRGGPN